MALQKELLTAFKEFTDAKGLTVNAQGLDSLTKLISTMPDAEFNMVFPHAVNLLNGLKDELAPDSVEKKRIEDLLVSLKRSTNSNTDKRKILNRLFLDKAIQECLMAQLRQHQANTGVSDQEVHDMKKSEKKSFAQKALEKFMGNCDQDVRNLGSRNAYDPLGMFFNHLFDALGLMLDVMLDKMGVKMPEPAEVEPAGIHEADRPDLPGYMPPPRRG